MVLNLSLLLLLLTTAVLVVSATSTSTSLTTTTTIIPTPSSSQLRYQETDFVALIHYNMATYAKNGDPGCDKTNWNRKAKYATGKTSDPTTFNPPHLNITQWFDSIIALGANIAVLTAKHGCGFCLWPTKSKLPNGQPYNYNVWNNATTSTSRPTQSSSSSYPMDILNEFVNVANRFGVGYGFYYSIMKNFYLCRDFYGSNSCLKNEVLDGQYNVTDEEYITIVTQHVTELYTLYGNLTEIWVDSKLLGMEQLMIKYQPQAVGGTPFNPTDWCGTESGYPSKDVGNDDIWDTGYGYFGNVSSKQWVPKFCDPQLFQKTSLWFWEPNQPIRTLNEMIDIYHDIVGRSMVMEIAFSINRNGLVDLEHEILYKQLGNWVTQCYGYPITSITMMRGKEFNLIIPANVSIDRIMIQENIIVGQRIRNYTVVAVVVGSQSTIIMQTNQQQKEEDQQENDIDDREDAEEVGEVKVVVAKGHSVGRKRIHLFQEPIVSYDTPWILKLIVHDYIAVPQIKQFAAYSPCVVVVPGEEDESDDENENVVTTIRNRAMHDLSQS